MSSLSGTSPQGKGENPVAEAMKGLMDEFAADQNTMAPQNEIVTRVTTAYLGALEKPHLEGPMSLERRLLTMHNHVVRMENTKTNTATERLPVAKHLTCWQIAQVMLRFHDVVRVVFSGSKALGVLAIYAPKGPDEGTYVVDETELRRIARQYKTSLSLKEAAEVIAILQEGAPTVEPCRDPDLIAVNNGIFDYKRKILMGFTPSTVLLSKVRVDYVDSPKCPTIPRPDGTSWDVESWMESLSDDPERVSLAWHVLGAVIRPNVSWNKAVLLFNEAGNNGKGTLLALCRNLVGADSWAALSIADFEERFRLAEIVNKTAFGADENAVGGFTEKMANLKATITGDVVMIERKNKDPYWYQPRGLMIQCINSLPKSKDVSESYYRRLLFWKFDKSFTVGEDEAIKSDYLQREEVLQYFLWRALNLPDYYKLPEPESSKAVLAEFKETNDPVREFWGEVEEELAWDLLPQEFLHDLFMAWSERANPRSGGLKRRELYNRLRAIVVEDDRWEDGQHGTSSRMDATESLVFRYDLSWWPQSNQHYTTAAGERRSTFKPKYRGLLRRTPRQGTKAATGGGGRAIPPSPNGVVSVVEYDPPQGPASNIVRSDSTEKE